MVLQNLQEMVWAQELISIFNFENLTNYPFNSIVDVICDFEIKDKAPTTSIGITGRPIKKKISQNLKVPR